MVDQTENKNMLQGLNFKFTLDRIPNTAYFAIDATLPAMTIASVDEQTPFNKMPVPGDHIDFEEFMVTFNVDEDLSNYKELQKWMLEIGFPESFDQYKKAPNWNCSDGTLTIMDSQFMPIKGGSVVFKDMWPMSLSSIMWSISQENIVYAQCAVSFAYSSFSFVE